MRPTLLGILGAALLSVGLSPAAQAGQVQATFDPMAAGLTGTAFSADALTGGEVSRISNGPFYADGSFDWQEIGYLNITGTIVNGAAVTPTGLGSTYTLYVTFTLNGHQPSMTSPGQATSGMLSLYGVNGVSSFGFDGADNATITNFATPVLLATTSLISLQTFATMQSPPPDLALDLSAALAADFTPVVNGFFSSPAAMVTLIGAFSHPSSGVEILNDGAAFKITGGNDVLTFVPEPASVSLLAAGLLGAAAMRRRKAG